MPRLRLAGFVRTLRDNGFAVGLGESRDALRLLATELAQRPDQARHALRALLCGRRSDWDRFDAVFDAYWHGVRVNTRVPSAGPSQTAQSTRRTLAPADADRMSGRPSDLATGSQDGGATPTGRREGASTAEQLAHTDFRHLADADELARAHALAAQLARRMRARLLRRQRADARGRRIDLRRTVRASLPTGGTPLRLIRQRPRERQLRLVLLVDTSGSMELYTAVFLRFVHGLLDHFAEAEAFLFHTRLVHVSPALRERDAARALDRLSLMAEGVGGGTRIGDSLAAFNRFHAPAIVHDRTCVIVFSDGYDTGDPTRVAEELARLRRRTRRIAWLNPLLGWSGYEPTARGMAAALPHIDLFAPAHTLDSLAALEPYLARL